MARSWCEIVKEMVGHEENAGQEVQCDKNVCGQHREPVHCCTEYMLGYSGQAYDSMDDEELG